MKILSVVGARPQFIKIAPLCNGFNKIKKGIKHVIVHTGQHYDYNMSKIFFDELEIPPPDYHLGVGSGQHGDQTGKMLSGIESLLSIEKPDWVVVFGDTNSTLAGALAAAKMQIPLAHIEAGLRSYNQKMPEEINRVLTDHCSQMLFCPTKKAVFNLQKEGFKNLINKGLIIKKPCALTNRFPAVVNVGDIMYDAFQFSVQVAERRSKILQNLSLHSKNYYLATLHRAENTDNPKRFKNILTALLKIGTQKPVLLPIHPRTRKIIKSLKFKLPLKNLLRLIEPVGYFDMLILEKNALKILTDSGGVQKEAYFSRVPCITLRDETEWEETVQSEWNVVTGTSTNKIISLTLSDPVQHHYKNNDFFGNGQSSKVTIEMLLQNSRRI